MTIQSNLNSPHNVSFSCSVWSYRFWRRSSRWEASSRYSWQPSPTPCRFCQAPAPLGHSSFPSLSHGTPQTQLWTTEAKTCTECLHRGVYYLRVTDDGHLYLNFSVIWMHGHQFTVFTSLWVLHTVDLIAVYDIIGIDFPVNCDTGGGSWAWLLRLQWRSLRHWAQTSRHAWFMYSHHMHARDTQIWRAVMNMFKSNLPGIPLCCARWELELLPLA